MAMITASTKKGCLPWSSIGSISLGKECNSNGYIGHTFMINEEEIGLLRMGTCLEGSENMQNYLRRLFDKMTKSGFFPQELMIKCRKIKEKRLEAERHKEEAERQKEIDREEAIKSLIIGGASVIAKISDGLSSQSSNQTAVAPPCPRSPTGKHQYTTGSCCIHCGKSDGLVRL